MKTVKKAMLFLLAFVMLTSSSVILVSAGDSYDVIDEYPNYTNTDQYPNQRGASIDLLYYIDSQTKLVTIPTCIFEGKIVSVSYDLYNLRTKEFGVPESEEPIDYSDYSENVVLFLYTVYEIEISKTYKGNAEGTVYMALAGGRRSEDNGATWNDALDQFAYFESIGVKNTLNVVTYADDIKSCDQGKNYLFFSNGLYNGYYEMADHKLYALEEGTSGNQFGYVEMKEFLEANPDLLYEGSGDVVIGDVNGDGTVDSADAAIILRYDAGLIELDENQLAVADFNGDGNVDSADSTAILRFDAGVESD